MEKQCLGSGSEKTQLQHGAKEEGKSSTMLSKRMANRRDGDFGSDERGSAVKGNVDSKGVRSSNAGL